MEIKEIRRRNFERAIGLPRKHGDISVFAEQYDLEPSWISQILTGHRPLGEKAARKMESKLGMVQGALDIPQRDFSIKEPTAPYLRGPLRADQAAILEAYENSSPEMREAAKRLFGVIEDHDTDPSNET